MEETTYQEVEIIQETYTEYQQTVVQSLEWIILLICIIIGSILAKIVMSIFKR